MPVKPKSKRPKQVLSCAPVSTDPHPLLSTSVTITHPTLKKPVSLTAGDVIDMSPHDTLHGYHTKGDSRAFRYIGSRTEPILRPHMFLFGAKARHEKSTHCIFMSDEDIARRINNLTKTPPPIATPSALTAAIPRQHYIDIPKEFTSVATEVGELHFKPNLPYTTTTLVAALAETLPATANPELRDDGTIGVFCSERELLPIAQFIRTVVSQLRESIDKSKPNPSSFDLSLSWKPSA